MSRNRRQPAPGQLDLPLHEPAPEPEGEPERPALPKGWMPETAFVRDVELERRRARAARDGAGPPER